MILNCAICGTEFKRPGKQGLVAKTCSTKCMGLYFRAKPNCNCDQCGVLFHKKQSQINKNKTGNFCSRECLYEFKKEYFKGENNHQFGLKGNCNSSFKGNIIKKQNNKIVDLKIYVGHSHPFSDKNGRILYHRFLVEENFNLYDEKYFTEKKGKKYLNKNFHVHHIDFNHNNNDIKNLQVLTRSEHTSIHNKQKEIIRDRLGRIKEIKIVNLLS